MSCKEFVELVTEYLEGRLPDEDVRRFDEHMEDCFWCARYLEQMRVTVRALHRLPAEALSEPVRDQLLAAFRDWPRSA